MRVSIQSSAVLALMLGIAGCGSGDNAATGGGGTVAGGAGAGTPAGWNAADACSILDKAAVAEVLGRPVTSATVALVHEADGQTAATSECTYGSDDGNVASLMTRWSPIADNTPESMAMARAAAASAMKAFSDTPLEDVPGLGKAAFLASKIDQLNVFIDDSRMVVVTVQKVPDGKSGKDLAIALARKAGA